MSLNGLKEFRASDDYQELLNHKQALLDFYASPAFKAQQAWLESSQQQAAMQGLTAKTVEEREAGRARYLALDQLIKLPQFLGEVLNDETPEAE